MTDYSSSLKHRLGALLFFAFIPELVACESSPARGVSASRALARVGNVEITQKDLERAMAREPGAAAERYNTKESRRQLLEGLVRFEFMSQAAEAAGFLQDPEVLHAWKQQGVQKFIQARIGGSTSAERVTPDEVRAYYEANKAKEFSSPAAAQVQQLVCTSAKNAETLLAQAQRLPSDAALGFAKLVQEHSIDELTKGNGGHLGFVNAGSLHPAALIAASLALKAPGDLSQPIAVPKGWAIVRLVAKRAEAVEGIKDVETQIRQGLQRQRRDKALKDLIEQAQARTKITYTDP